MMRLFGSLLALSKGSKQPLLVLEQSLAAYLVTIKQYSYEPRFFSAQPPSAIPQEFRFSQTTDAGVKTVQEKSKSGIRVMSIQHVKPDRPTPHELRSYKLSALDQINIPSYVPFIFFYPNNVNGNTNIDIDTLVVERSKRLRDSLSETLTRFYPFAGKYIDDNHIECNDEGVFYVETRIDGDLSSFVAKPDYKLLQGLLPNPLNSMEPTRGQFLVLIQVNFFSCGGFAISMYNSHKLIDGRTYSTFLNAWASAAKGDPQKMLYPSFVSSSLFHPNTKAASSASCPLSFLAVRPMMLKSGKCSTKRFLFDSLAIQALKEKAAASVSSTHVVAVTSLIWKCATTAARKLRGERPSILQFAMNIRGRFTPPIPQNAIGNICWTGVASCDLKDSLRLESMIGHVKAGIAKVESGFLEKFKGEQGSDYIVDGMMRLGGQMSTYDADYYSSSSMCNSGFYEADFGWGRPVWSCYGNFNDDIPLYANVIILMDTSNGDGVEAWVTLSQEEMDILESDPDLLLYASVEPSPLQS